MRKPLICCDRFMQEILTEKADVTRDTCYCTWYRCPICKSLGYKLWRP